MGSGLCGGPMIFKSLLNLNQMSIIRKHLLFERLLKREPDLMACALSEFHHGEMNSLDFQAFLSDQIKNEERVLNPDYRRWIDKEEILRALERNRELKGSEDEDEHASNPGVA
jgi:hypothetical protein